MDLTATINKMRQEFNTELNTVMAEEVRKVKLDEETTKKLAEVLPEIIIPKLTAADEKQAHEIIKKLDQKIERMAELTAEIGTAASEYNGLVTELHGLLMGKDHSISVRHSRARTQFMLNNISRIVINDVTNALIGFRGMPDKDGILKRLRSYSGL